MSQLGKKPSPDVSAKRNEQSISKSLDDRMKLIANHIIDIIERDKRNHALRFTHE